MTPLILLLVALPGQDVEDRQTRGPVSALLAVAVPERVDRSAPRLTLAVQVTGPTGMQVDPARLGEDARAWRVSRASAWTGGDVVNVTQTLTLEQTRPGLQAVPSVSVGFRLSGGGETDEFEWLDPLGAVPPLTTDPTPTTPQRSALAWSLAILMLALWLGVLVHRLTRQPKSPTEPDPETLADLALADLSLPAQWGDARWAAGQLNETIRTFLTARTGLELHSRTVTECVDLLRTTPGVGPDAVREIERLLAWCDAQRFAPQSAASEGPEQARAARRAMPGWIGR